MVTVPNSEDMPQKSYVDYLQDVAGESQELDDDDEELRRLNTSSASLQTTDPPQRRRLTEPETPLNGMTSPQSTEASSFVNGLLSPFSPLLKAREKRNEFLEFVSLRPCRKVSLVVRVLSCNESEQRCLFPHVKNNHDAIHKPRSPHDVVVVKPSAFGKVIPSQVTMETARLVAQVAHISSEDWARLYEFHHVMWPDQQQGREDQGAFDDHFSTMDSLSRAAVQDALVERQSSVLISMGKAPTCIQTQRNLESSCMLENIVAHCRRLMESKAVATISMVELREEKDAFRDLFDRKNKTISIRHHDMKGAVLEGLTQVRLDDIDEAWSMTQKHKQQHTIVSTISIWDYAISQDLKRAPDSEITCVELARSSDPAKTSSKSSSTVSLGLALRQLLIHETLGTEPAISYRESTITKVLQRSLESSKIALIASVSQLSRDYEATLVTLNFLRRLLVKPGKTASSPFNSKQHSQDEIINIVNSDIPDNTSTADQLQQYAKDESLLEQIIADPRQRLAKILKQSPARSIQPEMIHPESEASFEEEYNPVDYMQGLDVDVPEWESPAPPAEETRDPSTSRSISQTIVLQDEEQPEEMWSMEEPKDESVHHDPGHLARAMPTGNYNFSNSPTPKEEFTPPHERDIFEEEQFAVSEESLGTPLDASRDLLRWEPESSILVGSDSEDEQSWSLGEGQHQLVGLSLKNDEVLLEASKGKETEPETPGDGDSRDLSQEIVFTNQEDSNSFLEESLGEPEMHVEWLQQSDQREELYQESQIAEDLGEAMESLENGRSNNDFRTDDSLISQTESKSSLVCQEARRLIEAPLPDMDEEQRPLSRQNINERIRNSAFQSVLPSRKSNPVQHSYTQPVKRGGYATHEELIQIDGGQYLDDVQVLEGAVNQIQNMQSGLWRSSAESLSKLRDALSSQRHEIARLGNEREMLSSIVSELKDEIKKNSEEQDHRLQRYEEEVQHLENQLNNDISKRKRLQFIVDEATSARDEMRVSMAKIISELEQARREVLATQDQNRSVLNAHGELEADARQARTELNDLKRDKEAMNRTYSKLQQSLVLMEEANKNLIAEASSKETALHDLSKRLKETKKDQQELEDQVRQLQGSRRQEALALEGLKLSNKALSLSLEEMGNEKVAREEGSQRDKAVIQKLQSELQEQNIAYDCVVAEKRAIQAEIMGLEQKLALADDESTAKGNSIRRLKERCQYFEEKLNQYESGRSSLEQQHRRQCRVVERLEDEVRTLESERSSDAAKIEQLKGQVCAEESLNLENETLREKYLQSERQRKELESILTRYKTDYYEDAQEKKREVIDFRNLSDELEHQVRMLKEREMESKAINDAEISRLKEEVNTYVAALEASNSKGFNLELQVRASDERFAAMNMELEKYRSEAIHAKFELNAAREKEERSSGVHIESLYRRIEELEGHVVRLEQDIENFSKKSEDEHSTREILSLELDRKREELSGAIRDVMRLEQNLKESESERLAQQRNLSTVKTSIHKLQFSTKERFHRLVDEQKHFAKLFDSLADERDILRMKLSKAQKERDACRRCLEFGREKLSHLIGNGAGREFLLAQIFDPIAATKKATGEYDPSRRLSKELYLSEHPVDQLIAVRAEQIASCLALSAKTSLQDSQDENSNLRSRVYSLEEEKRAEVAALKAQIRFLDGEAQRTWRLV